VPKFSLRTKLTLALLVTGLVSASAVGLAGRAILQQRFDRLVLDGAFTSFRNDVTDYIATYGSWEAAAAREPFERFERRRNGRGGPPRGDAFDERALPPPRGVTPRRPPPPDGRLRPGTAGRGGLPPFMFLVLDPAGQRVLHGPEDYLNGSKPVPASLRAAAVPIEVDGRVAALALPLRDPNFNAYDNEYLRAIRSAFTTGALIAALLSVLLGVFFGERLSRDLRTLTQAIKAMSRGGLPQKVHAATRDEIGVMAAVINRVSEDLAASHARIEQQAEELRELSVRDALTGPSQPAILR
jgi:hypothetical protein